MWYCFCLWGVSSVSFLGGEEPPIIYEQDVHVIIVECVDGLPWVSLKKPCPSCTSMVLVEYAWCARGSNLG